VARAAGIAVAALVALVAAGCGARPQEGVGVSRGPVVHYLLCSGDRVHQVRLSTPQGRTLWEIHSQQGSTRTAYRVGETPPGFRQRVAFGGLARTTRVSGPDGKAAMQFSAVPREGIARGDGEIVTATQFAARRSSYCGATRQGRAAALAIGFVFLGLAALFAIRWVRAKQARDPYRRPWR